MYGPGGYQGVITKLKHIECQQIISEGDAQFIRALAFTHGGRKLSYGNAIKHLITALAPLAIKERLTS